ncbi:hypothetical protein Y032_0233g3094 [Ancylostoma ceylanicum]|uniref:Uncharacterized protein n=1 Tax=Ancylostoma ceylanicum TaxID=53326 RepID=A0A016SG33_9BILA|nr:hypothetical protein Y032_0233g3094 [Ancylostoma ceylanicum]
MLPLGTHRIGTVCLDATIALRGSINTPILLRTAAPQHLRGAGEATLSVHTARPRRVDVAARQSAGVAIVIHVPCTCTWRPYSAKY